MNSNTESDYYILTPCFSIRFTFEAYYFFFKTGTFCHCFFIGFFQFFVFQNKMPLSLNLSEFTLCIIQHIFFICKKKSNIFFFNFSADVYSASYLLYRFGLVYRQALHQPYELFLCEFFYLICIFRPSETACFKTFIHQKKSVSLPQECLQSVFFSSTEQKQTLCKRVKPAFLFHYRRQTVY